MKKHVEFSILDIEKLIKYNDLKEVSSPIIFIRPGVPDPNGLLSNEIFGLGKDERANIFAYIDLYEDFVHPLMLKRLIELDRKILDIVLGNGSFVLNEEGMFERAENGETGIGFLKKNYKKLKFKRNESNKRNVNITFFEKNKDKMFMNKLLVIPAFYRDIRTGETNVGIGDINKLYKSVIMSVKSMKDSADYGFSLSDLTKGRIQLLILEIYDWFIKEPNLAKKNGIIKRAVLSKTTDYASRIVLSAPDLVVERYEDLESDIRHSSIPLSSLCSNLFPFIIFWLRRFFENEFSLNSKLPVFNKKTKQIEYVFVKDPLSQFSDDVLKKQVKRFIHSFSNRLAPVRVTLENGKTVSLVFKGKTRKIDSIHTDKSTTREDILNEGQIKRRLTWCDLLFIACSEVSKDKVALLTRYPIDSMYNQFPTKIKVASMKQTEPMYYDNSFFPKYPKIREEDIGANTSNMFVDTLRVSNVMLGAIGGDYDGDQVTCKVAYTKEANDELNKYLDSKLHCIDFGCSLIRSTTNEGVQALYNLTKILPNTKLTDPEF